MIYGSSHQYYLYNGVTDMRKSFDGLSGLIRTQTTHELLNGDVFIFINRRCDRIKLLRWEGSGFGLYYKRLEGGTFEKPLWKDDQMSITLSWSEVILLLEGIELKSVKRRKRYHQKK